MAPAPGANNPPIVWRRFIYPIDLRADCYDYGVRLNKIELFFGVAMFILGDIMNSLGFSI